MNPRRLAVAYAIGLAPALAMALGQPVWSRVDEPAHYDVIAQYAAGVYPHDSVTTIRPETLEIMERTGVYGFVVDNEYQRPGGFATMPAGLTDAQHVLWNRRHVWQYSYEAFQPPLYYAAALPAWKLGDAIGGAFGALYAVRIFDALLAALLAPLSMLLVGRLWPAQPAAGWGAAVLTAALPGVDVNLTSVSNDVLVAVLGGVTLLVAIGGRVTLRRALLVGACLGAAVLTKTTAVALIPAVIVALAWRGRLTAALAALAAAAAVVLPWIASNVAVYGEIVTTREQVAMSAFPARTVALDFWSVSTLHAFVTFWSGDPFLSLPTAVPLTLVAALLSALCVAGLIRAWSSSEVDRPVLVVFGVAAAGAAAVSVGSPVLAAFNAPGRLAYVSIGAVVALVTCGLWFELRSWRLRRAAIAIFAALTIVGLAVLAYPAAAPAIDPGQPVVADSSPLFATRAFQGVIFTLQVCAVDAHGDLWLEVLIENTGPRPAEWSQSAEILAGAETLATSDYARSTPLPMSVPAASQVTGWLWLGPQSRIPRRRSLSVRFRDVAVDGYRAVGDVVIATPLC